MTYLTRLQGMPCYLSNSSATLHVHIFYAPLDSGTQSLGLISIFYACDQVTPSSLPPPLLRSYPPSLPLLPTDTDD